ncbi:MAG TPA: hypothetical protein VLK82_11095, partial [Candidatus Tectomicrobia bacterium]|nr:hypothetical protein [Candidatus Tectomicrobia bacterium]
PLLLERAGEQVLPADPTPLASQQSCGVESGVVAFGAGQLKSGVGPIALTVRKCGEADGFYAKSS